MDQPLASPSPAPAVGTQDSRDLVAFYKREEGGNVCFRAGLVPRDDAGVALKPGLRFVRVGAGARTITRRWVAVP